MEQYGTETSFLQNLCPVTFICYMIYDFKIVLINSIFLNIENQTRFSMFVIKFLIVVQQTSLWWLHFCFSVITIFCHYFVDFSMQYLYFIMFNLQSYSKTFEFMEIFYQVIFFNNIYFVIFFYTRLAAMKNLEELQFFHTPLF